MSTIELVRIDDAFKFEATNERGQVLQLDASPKIGGGNDGYRPMELLLAGVAGCSAIDIINILRKQKIPLTGMRIVVKGIRADEVPAVFTDIHLDYYVYGAVPQEKAARAADLSVHKYCSAMAMINQVAAITYDVHIESDNDKTHS